MVDEVNSETPYRNQYNSKLQSYLQNKTVLVSKNPQTTLLKRPATSFKEYSVFPRKRRVSNEELKKVNVVYEQKKVVIQEQKKVVIPSTRVIPRIRTESMSEHVKRSKWLRQRQISNIRTVFNNALVEDESLSNQQLPNTTKKVRLAKMATLENGCEAFSDDLADDESLGGWEVGCLQKQTD